MKFQDIASSVLLENWGNLSKINSEILRRVAKRKHTLGQNSVIERMPVRSANSVFENLRQGKNYAMVVLQVNADQLLAIFPVKNDFECVVGTHAISELVGKNTKLAAFYNTKDIINNIKIILAAAKEQNAAVVLLGITSDQTASQLQKQRAKLVRGSVPVQNNKNKDKIEKAARAALSDRLVKFKSNKAIKVEDYDQFLAAMLENGYLDRFNVGGFIYKRDDRNRSLYIGDIINPGKSSFGASNYFEYIMDADNSPKLKELANKFWDFKQTLPKVDKEDPSYAQIKAQEDEFYNSLSQYMLPRTLKVVLGLKGGAIVPVKIDADMRDIPWLSTVYLDRNFD